MENIYTAFKLLPGANEYIDIHWQSGFGNRILHFLHLFLEAMESTPTP
jgi:hypothetical protein